MKAIKRAVCPVCKWACNTDNAKLNKDGLSEKLKCKKDGSAMKLSTQWYVRDADGKYIPCGLLKKDADAYIAGCVTAKHTGSIMPGKELPVMWEDGKARFFERKMKPETHKYYTNMLRSLDTEFAKNNLVDVTPKRLTDFAAARTAAGLSDRTVAGEIGTVKRLFILVTRPLSAKEYPRLHEAKADIMKVEKPTVDNCKDDYYTAEDVKLLIKCAPERLAISIRIQIETGLRPGNVYSLKFSDISSDGTISVAPDDFKNGDAFITSISAELLQDINAYRMKRGIRNWLFPSPVKKDFHVLNMRKLWVKAIAAADKSGTPHKLRHSFASIMLGQDAPIVMVSSLMGHSDVSVTMKRYGHLEHGKKREALDEYRAKMDL